MLPQRTFGRTGHSSTVTLFGAAALGRVSQADADRTVELLLDYGVNHIDTAASYGDAERLLGPWLEKHRDRFFLATKTNEREYETAKAQIRRSLELMRVDHIDLIQFHNLGHPDDWDTAMGENGALEAAKEARDQGLDKAHWRHRPRPQNRSLPLPKPAGFRFRFNPAPMEHPIEAEPAIRLRLRPRSWTRSQTGHRRADHQIARTRALGNHAQNSVNLVSAVGEPARHRPRRPLDPRPGRSVPEHARRYQPVAQGPRRSQPLRRPGPQRRRDGRHGRRTEHDPSLRVTRST